MTKPKGGRGKKAPYETQQMRVPLPVKARVEKLIEDFRNQVLEVEADVKTVEKKETEEENPLIEELQLRIENLNTALQATNERIHFLEVELERASERALKLNTGFSEESLRELVKKWKTRSTTQSPTNQRWQWGRAILKELEELIGEEITPPTTAPDGQLSLLDQQT